MNSAPTFEVVKRNVETGGPVVKVYRPTIAAAGEGRYPDRETARAVAAAFNAREGRTNGASVVWTVREVRA